MRFPEDDILYWQDKSRREVDFVVRRGRGRVDLVECKINPDKMKHVAVRGRGTDDPDLTVSPPRRGAPPVRQRATDRLVCAAQGRHPQISVAPAGPASSTCEHPEPSPGVSTAPAPATLQITHEALGARPATAGPDGCGRMGG